MPKKNKTKQNVVDNHEGKPPGLCLGDFIVTNKTTPTVLVTEPGNARVTTNQDNSSVESEVAICKADSSKPSAGSDVQSIYYVCRTKKGGIPIKVEKRASGKKVTLVEHVLGDGKALVSELKSKFGTGGLFKDGVVELQGDLLTKVSRYFNDNKGLLKPYGTKL